MQAMQFDATLAPGRKAREIVATAGETLFPDLLPEPKAPKRTPAPGPMDGEVPLFEIPPAT